ncbi:hypothetical protein L6R52_05115 [Myxococcota bacterium]|nr:hypothetical protein [Myxococcota bacterium]
MMPLRAFSAPCALFTLSLSLAACGSDSDPSGSPDAGPRADASTGGADASTNVDTNCDPAFEMASACGGNPVGTWTYVKACSEEDPFATLVGACGGATSSNIAYATGGTLTLNSDGTLTRQSNDTVTGDLAVPASCAALAGGCPGIEAAIEVAGGGATTASCSSNVSGGCDCAVTSVVMVDDTGTWIEAEGTITVTSGIVSLYWYCTGNGVLKYRGVEGNPDRTTYVLTR